MRLTYFFASYHLPFSSKVYSKILSFRLFFHFLTEIGIKSKQNRGRNFSRFLNLLWDWTQIFSLIPPCGIRKSLPEIGHLSEQIFFAPLFLQPLHFGPSFVESWASDTEEWVCCCKISDLLLKMQNDFVDSLVQVCEQYVCYIIRYNSIYHIFGCFFYVKWNNFNWSQD